MSFSLKNSVLWGYFVKSYLFLGKVAYKEEKKLLIF